MTPMELRRIGQNRGQWGRAKFRSQKTQPESGYQMRAGRLEGVAEAVGLVRSLPPSWRYRRLGPGMQLWWGGALGTHCHRSWGSRSCPRSRGAAGVAGASEVVALWRWEAGVGQSPLS